VNGEGENKKKKRWEDGMRERKKEGKKEERKKERKRK
jgi:hypothetical protein